jgi:sec-independent protein translocase protein TatB
MFGLSWGQIAIIVLVGVFVLGPERIPTAVTWVMSMLRKARTMAAGAQEELRREIGPEIEELRRQVADLQSLKELQDLRDLRDLHPKRLIGKNILGDEFSGGMTGFLGLNNPVKEASPGPGAVPPPPATAATPEPAPAAPSMVKKVVNGSAAGGTTAAAMAGGTNVPAPPSITRLAPPRVVGSPAPRRVANASASAEQTPFDPDGT